jgi:hypothetical protein
MELRHLRYFVTVAGRAMDLSAVCVGISYSDSLGPAVSVAPRGCFISDTRYLYYCAYRITIEYGQN